jgi:hypothetical protein
MSIQDFHSQLTSGNDQDALMGTLRKLSQLEDITDVSGLVEDSGWGIWDSTTA